MNFYTKVLSSLVSMPGLRLEVQFEDELPTSSSRATESEAEIGAEDLVSIESVPVPSKQLPQVPPKGDSPRADALTVNPWLGRESIDPFLAAAR